MRGGLLGQLLKAQRAAVAPTVGISLFALIGVGGIAFDYARLASMDSELQSAADQAALAAVTQLDGKAGACSRAANAAYATQISTNSLAKNNTRFSNDGEGSVVTITNEPSCDRTGFIRFYAKKDRSDLVDPTDATANFVEVTVDGRTAFYALTPVVAAFSSGEIRATAYAGLGSAVCKVPPVMMCNPAEPLNNEDWDYPFSYSPGVGIRLVVGAPSTPGNFGFLQTGYGTGAQPLARALGYNDPPADCVAATGVDTEPGDKESVRAAFNTRFDLSESGLTCPAGGTCSPSQNSRKDLVRGNNCGTSGNQAWQEAANPYRPTSPTTSLASDGSEDPDIMGYPRDMCHAVSLNGVCETDGNTATVGDIAGDGAWDRDAYFRVNYGWGHDTWVANTGLSTNATRYQVYDWEMDNPSTVQSAGANLQTMPDGKTGHASPICRPPGVTPNASTPDRRRISVAVVNCEAQNLSGREYGVEVLQWAEVFLVEPAFARGSGPSARSTNGDIYVELIGETGSGTAGSTAGQVIRRDVPYLIE